MTAFRQFENAEHARITLRLEAPVAADLYRRALMNDRSVSGEIRHALRNYLAEDGDAKPTQQQMLSDLIDALRECGHDDISDLDLLDCLDTAGLALTPSTGNSGLYYKMVGGQA